MKFEKVALIGCGLMGGSFALAAKRAGWAPFIVGYSASESSRQKALGMGVIDLAVNNIEQAVQGADLVLLAVPVKATEACFKVIAPALKSEALLMDVGSTKSDIVAAALNTLGDKLGCFVPVHPIAGKEVAGVEHSDADLYKDRALIVTPMASSGATQVQLAKQVWKSLGSYITELTPAAHDAAFAAVSHLPHVLSYAIIRGIFQQHNGPDLIALGGPGFRDFSRIAASDPVVWRDILTTNRDQVLLQIRHFKDALSDFEKAIQDNEPQALEDMIRQASDLRFNWRMGASQNSEK
ncbi:prephenate dehydrogenase [Limnohabitans sp. Rim11]|jgi:prephenate dehydrogenase|uniref:prephenate dehydrogenase n=1 Tax=Limnohabitans sp. Rim11 TaxID=1100719 RepID=UPI000AA6C2BB|nr:prephenate dehydrogenase [Limnohabitans sp. Rim11]